MNAQLLREASAWQRSKVTGEVTVTERSEVHVAADGFADVIDGSLSTCLAKLASVRHADEPAVLAAMAEVVAEVETLHRLAGMAGSYAARRSTR